MSHILTRIAAVAALSFVTVMAAPQAQPPSFTTATRTVAVYATVTNARGRLVPDLSRDDFAIDDNGRRQTLTLFALRAVGVADARARGLVVQAQMPKQRSA